MIKLVKHLAFGMKKALLKTRRSLRLWINYFILGVSAVLFLIAFSSNIAHRMPIISFFSDKISFPHKYELNCVVELTDENNDSILAPVEIEIGGFSEEMYSGEECKMTFVSTRSRNIPLLISFSINGVEYTRIERISFELDYAKRCALKYHVGE